MKINREVLPILILSLSGFTIFAAEQTLLGYLLILLALTIALFITKTFFRDTSLVAIGIVMVSLVPITTDISYSHMVAMAIAMTAAIAVPYLLSRYVYKDHTIRFSFGWHEPWNKIKWIYLALVAIVGYIAIPVYMISFGTYTNWPDANSTELIARLFVGTNALGIWDELFFIILTFTVFYKYLPFAVANVMQAVIFTSFLYELGFDGVGPVMIFVFALTQGYIYKLTHSLFYLLCIHLLFDFILFLVLIHAYNREFLPVFIY